MSDSRPPIPVRPISFNSAEMYTGRPGAITFLGIFGMLVAVFGAMFSGYILLFLSMFSTVAATTAGGAKTAAAPGVIWSVTQGNVAEAPTAMSAGDRKVVLEAMNDKVQLSPQRQQLVDTLLSEHGIEILPLTPGGLNKPTVASVISEAGPTDDGKAVYFVFSTGRLQVSDLAATFRLAETSENFRVDASNASAPGSSLTKTEIDQAVASIKNGELNPAQRVALPKYLADPSQVLINKKMATTNGIAIFASATQGDMAFISSSTGGWVQMDAQGNVVGTPNKPAVGWGLGVSIAKVPMPVRMTVNFENAISVLLSVGLFIICIGALRYAPKTRKRYMLYSAVKILAVLIGSFAIHQYTAALGWSGAGMLAGIYLVCGLIFPVLALTLVNTTGVRNFFASQGH